jgi:hypothetical protein
MKIGVTVVGAIINDEHSCKAIVDYTYSESNSKKLIGQLLVTNDVTI